MLRSLGTCVALILGVATSAGAAEPAPAAGAVREIDVKGVKLGVTRGRPDAPVAIKSAAELEKSVPDAEGQAKIKAAVDFTKEQLVLFVWSGSGQDRVTAAEEKVDGKLNVVFTYAPGRTRDYRPHQHVFVLPADATWTMAGGKRK